MSTKKAVRLERKEAELYEKQGMSNARRVGLLGVLASVLAGPVATVPFEDPRRPREEQAWRPEPKGHAPKDGPPVSGPTKPTVYMSPGAKEDPNLYLRKVRKGPGVKGPDGTVIREDEVFEYGNRLKDRERELKTLLKQLGLPTTHRQVKRILRGFMPPRLVAWLDAQKELDARAIDRRVMLGDGSPEPRGILTLSSDATAQKELAVRAEKGVV